MSSINYRQEVVAVYPDSPSWAAKIKAMPDYQVMAIFMRMRKDGKIRI